MRAFVWLLIGLLIIIQQDYWNWENDTLVFGFVPHTLAYQCAVSIVTAVVWILVVNFCWPKDLVDELPSDEVAS